MAISGGGDNHTLAATISSDAKNEIRQEDRQANPNSHDFFPTLVMKYNKILYKKSPFFDSQKNFIVVL